MNAFESLQQLFKSIGLCTYASSPEALPGVSRHTLTFQTDHTNTAVPCLDDSAELTLRYNDARVEWQVMGSLFGAAAEEGCNDPVVFLTHAQAEAERRISELRLLLSALQVTVSHGIKGSFVDWLRDLQKCAYGDTFALRNERGDIVGGGWESPKSHVKAFFSSTGLWEHKLGWYEQPATHVWPVHRDSIDALEKRCAEYLKDTQYVVREAVRILRNPDSV